MIIGIDLGTTNSLVGVWRNGASLLIPNAVGDLMTPSAVSIGEDNEVLVGLAARDRLVTHPQRSAAAFKRYMGSDKSFELGGRRWRPEDLSALVLQHLKSDAEVFFGEPVERAVITVPAYFNDTQRKATRAAGEMAGLKVERLLTEPTAAALAYGAGPIEDEALILVADLGGGTFDVSLLHCFSGVMDVRAAAGDSWLGGEDFVDVIVGVFVAHHGLNLQKMKPSGVAMLRREAELAKRRLSEAESVQMTLRHGGKALSFDLTRAEFETLCEPLLARARAPIERALRDARVRPEDLSQVILAGGASRMPMFRKLIARLFRRMPAQQINPDEVVARGAAVRAGLMMREIGLEEAVMIDVAPFTLGIEVTNREAGGRWIEGLFCPVIERNSVTPCSRSTRVSTLYDGQKELRITVFQGESRFVKDNVRLGQLLIGVPAAPAGAQTVDVRLTVDASGLIELDARAVSTDVLQSLVIEPSPGALSPEEIQTRLAALAGLKRHPREDAENQALLARGARLYEQRLGAVREAVGEALIAFTAALEDQDLDRIRLCRAALRRVLERHDDNVFF
jgi:molecular chaperone HscC